MVRKPHDPRRPRRLPLLRPPRQPPRGNGRTAGSCPSSTAADAGPTGAGPDTTTPGTTPDTTTTDADADGTSRERGGARSPTSCTHRDRTRPGCSR